MRKLLLLSIIFVLCVNNCFSQTAKPVNNKAVIKDSRNQQDLQPLRFEHLTVADGLTDNSVLTIIQDHLGYIWMGTLYGLVSYDGATITPFQYNPENPHSLKTNIIFALHEDKKGDIWIGSQNLFRFERATQRFIEYPNKNIVIKGPVDFIEFIYEDKQGNIWLVANNNGGKKTLERLDPVTGTWTSFQNDPRNSKVYSGSIPKGDMISYGFSKTGEIVVNFSADNETIPYRFNSKTGKLEALAFKSSPEVREVFNKSGSAIIAFDKKGQLYFSSFMGEGLFVLNPATGQMTQFKHDAVNSHSLLADTTHNLYADSLGFIWVLTAMGIDRYDPQTGEFSHYISLPDNFSTPTKGRFMNVVEGANGNLWFMIDGELNYYDRRSNRFLRYQANAKSEDGLISGFGVNTGLVDRSGLLWASGQNAGVNKESRINHFPFISKIPGNKNSLLDSNVNTVYEAASEPGIIWFGTNKGLDRLDKKTGIYTHYVHDDKVKNSLSKEQVNGIAEDQKGRFWVSTHQGLNLMDRKTGTFTFFTHDSANANSLGHEHVTCLKIASNGMIWIGTDAGVGYFDYDKNKFSHYLKADTSYTPKLFELIEEYTTPGREIAAIKHPGNNEDKTVLFSIAQSMDVLVTALGTVNVQKIDWGWIENAAGKVAWDMNKANVVLDGSGDMRAEVIHLVAGNYKLRYKSDQIFSYGHWIWVTPYHPELWGIQLTRVNGDEAKIFNAEAGKRFYNGMADNNVLSLGEDMDHNIWIGGGAGGVSKFDPATGKFSNYVDLLKGPTSVPGSILQDKKTGNIWVGDFIMGLLLMDKNGNILKRYNNTNGLSSNAIMGVQQDAKGFLWISTNNGLCRFDPVTGRSQLFGKKHGLQGLEFNTGAFCRTADGEFYFAGKNGVNAFYPDEITMDTIAPQVALTNLFIGGKPATLGADSQMPVHISVAKDIALKYDQNDLTFHYTTLLYNRGNESQFAYRLSPNDKDWIQAGTLRQVRYTNLSPGTYIFTVKAANADGVWNEKGTSFSFTILPPWWKTWWAYSLYFILVVGSGWYYVKNRERALKARQKKLEQTVAKRTAEVMVQKERAQQSEKFKQQFLANMSHEIRTPMNAVMGMTNLVLDTPINEKQRFYMQGIKNSSDALLHIINDILDLSKMEAGKMEVENIDFSISVLIEQVKQLLQHKADEKEIELITNIDGNIPDILIGDAARLNQVLINLAGNAIKFTEKGSVTIEVKKGAGENSISFSIIDTGIGIPADKLQTVFESFSQAHLSDTRKYGGTGLGLTISKQLVELMGGKIAIESEEGAGTIFSFEINCAIGSMEGLRKNSLAEQVDGTVLNGLRILVVDDNEYNRIVVRDTLQSKANVEISEATNGKEAVELMTENEFDIVLMDVQMPVMDGYQATRYIRENFDDSKNKIPVIALTASVVRSDLDKCRAAGMNDYVPKPFKVLHLINTIAKATGRSLSKSSKNEDIKMPGSKVLPPIEDVGGAVTNLSYLEKFCEGDKARMQKYIGMYLDTAPLLIEGINTALTNKDYNEIATQVHGYKTKWIMMGMNESKNLALKIEQECREENQANGLNEKIAMLMRQVEKAIHELNN
jgi:two-component system sensor histidine kinase ChiS